MPLCPLHQFDVKGFLSKVTFGSGRGINGLFHRDLNYDIITHYELLNLCDSYVTLTCKNVSLKYENLDSFYFIFL